MAAAAPRALAACSGQYGSRRNSRASSTISACPANDGVGLMRLGDHPHRSRKDAGFAPDALGEGRLVGRANLDLGIRHDSAGRAIDQVDAERPKAARQLHGILDLPAVLHPVDGRDAHEERQRIRPRAADRGGHFQRKAYAAVECAAILVGAVVRQGREKLVDQVAVRGVDFDDLESGGDGPPRGRRECLDDRAGFRTWSARPAPALPAGTGWDWARRPANRPRIPEPRRRLPTGRACCLCGRRAQSGCPAPRLARG
jgi:hypothetical protein